MYYFNINTGDRLLSILNRVYIGYIGYNSKKKGWKAALTKTIQMCRIHFRIPVSDLLTHDGDGDESGYEIDHSVVNCTLYISIFLKLS